MYLNMLKWGGQGPEDRGISHVLGIVVLVSVVVVSAVLIVQVGQQTLGAVNNDANTKIAEEVMLSLDDSLQRSEANESVDVPDRVRSDIDVSSHATYNLTLNEQAACSTGNRSLQTIRYEKNEKQVGYEGGGVWRMTESGATMSSPPAVSYESGSLAVSFSNISGDRINGNSMSVRSDTNTTRSHERALEVALYTDATYEDARSGLATPPTQACRPSQATNATLTIKNSSYARAWADWAQSTYDDKYVDVTPTSVEPGETVQIRFALGDVSDPRFEVGNISVQQDPTDSGKAVMSATVRNTGGLKSTQDIALKHNQSGSPSEVLETVTLIEGESTTVSKSLDVSDAEVHNFTVESDEDTAYKIINYTAVPGSPSLDITSNSIPATARLNQVPSATVTVTNTGSMTADQSVTFFVNGSQNATRSVTVHPGQSQTVDFGPSMPTDENGTYDLEVTTDDDTYSQYSDDGHYFLVGDSGVFEVASVSPPGGVESGDTATIAATIKNTGDIRSSSSVEIRLENESGAKIASKNKTLTLNGTRNGVENETVTLTSGSLTAPSYSNYTYLVKSPDDRLNGTFTVGASAPPVFDVTSVTVDNPVGPENETQVGFTVTNTGGTADTQTLRISKGWGGDKSSEEHLAPGESTTVNQTVIAPSEEGFYRLHFTTENQTTWQTLNVQSSSLVERNGSNLTANTKVNATIELKGAELEGSNGYYISHTRVEMSLFVENQSGIHRIPLWRDAGHDFENGDVNGPHAERRLINDEYANPYEYSKTFEENSNFSIFSRSYHCDDQSGTNVTFEIDGNEYDTLRCSDPGPVRISISDPENNKNVDILRNGEEVPGYGEADPEQRSLEDMLGEQRLNETEGSDRASLDLADGERVFLYELSKRNANPENAYDNDDPDYNDAVVLFRVNSIEKDITEPEFRIVDVDAPARVDETTNAHVTATVKNVGSEPGNATLESTFDGSAAGTDTKDIEPNETKYFTFVFGTGSKPTEQSYLYNVSLSNERKQWGGNIYVGELDEQFMQADSVRAPGTIDSDESANATINITNVGGEAGTAEVELYTKNTDDASSTFTKLYSAPNTTSLLTHGDTEQINISMPTDRGNYTYYVQTRNSTSAKQSFFVGRSNVVVNDTQGINIGAEKYDTSTLIERRGGAQRITVEVLNNGTVGDEREVNLTVRNKSDGKPVFTGSKNITAGSGDLTSVDEYPAWAGFDADLDPGYYTYEVSVYNDTASGSVDDTATGEIYLKEVDESGATANDSPVSVDSDTVTLGG